MTMNISKNNYYQEKLSQIIASKQTYTEIEFEDCEFFECHWIDCTFEKCKFINCRFHDCLISATRLTNSRFRETIFKNCKVIGIDWTTTQSLQYLSFENCQINYSNFHALYLSELKILSCEAVEVDFSETNLTQAILTNTDFNQSIFSKTNLHKADLQGAKNYYIDPRQNTIKDATFSLPEALSLLETLDIILK